MLSQENKELREEIKNKIVQIEQLSKDMANILKRVEAIEKEKSKHFNPTNDNVREQTVSSWRFSSNNILNAIDDSSNESDKLNCYICKTGFYSNKELRYHNISRHKGNESNEVLNVLKCKNCSENFETIQDWKTILKVTMQYALCVIKYNQLKNH